MLRVASSMRIPEAPACTHRFGDTERSSLVRCAGLERGTGWFGASLLGNSEVRASGLHIMHTRIEMFRMLLRARHPWIRI